jgi:hypothetical protein
MPTPAEARFCPSQPLGDEISERVADDDRLRVEPADDLGVLIDDVVDPVAGDAVGLLARFLDSVRIAGPGRRDGHVALLAEELDPRAPRVGMKPKSMDEDDGRSPHGRRKTFDLDAVRRLRKSQTI